MVAFESIFWPKMWYGEESSLEREKKRLLTDDNDPLRQWQCPQRDPSIFFPRDQRAIAYGLGG